MAGAPSDMDVSKCSLTDQQYAALLGAAHRIGSFTRLVVDVLENGPTGGMKHEHRDAFRYLLHIVANDAKTLETVLDQGWHGAQSSAQPE